MVPKRDQQFSTLLWTIWRNSGHSKSILQIGFYFWINKLSFQDLLLDYIGLPMLSSHAIMGNYRFSMNFIEIRLIKHSEHPYYGWLQKCYSIELCTYILKYPNNDFFYNAMMYVILSYNNGNHSIAFNFHWDQMLGPTQCYC